MLMEILSGLLVLAYFVLDGYIAYQLVRLWRGNDEFRNK